ncbi:MAG: peptidase S41 [Thermoanaerobaculia bacterium]|nr:MAG: peptidase S41 [Thermoanaerobaculia bacterium]
MTPIAMRARRGRLFPAAALAAAFLTAPLAAEGVRPHAGMLRWPDISAGQVVFSYADDLWLVPREGGLASPLASPPGGEMRPKFSPDGRTIAFVGNYDGNNDLYTVPIEGGVPVRVTYHPTTENLTEWTPDGRLMFFAGGMGTYPRTLELWTVAAAGGLPVKVPVPYGANGAVSADGKWLAYTLHTHDHRTWKRYRGGMATDVWLFQLETRESRRITDWEGTDSQPMWNGAELVYLSDEGPSHRLNLWSYDTRSGERRALTRFDDFDVKWPSIGPGPEGRGEVVFQHGAALRALDLGSGALREIEVRIPGARAQLRPRRFDVAGRLAAPSLSPTAKRVLVEARGDIWTLPAEHGSPRALTRTSGVAERDPAWSPDGDWVAYFADASGEYELYVAAADGTGEPRRLTTGADRFLSSPTWSPDSKKIAFWDLSGALQVTDVATGRTALADRDPWAPFPPPRVTWSSDSGWIAYPWGAGPLTAAIRIHDVRKGKTHQVTSGRFADGWPVFDRKGDFLYFTSARKFDAPTYEDVGTTFAYAQTGLLYAVPLRQDVASPLLPKSDEEGAPAEDEKEGENGAAKGEDAGKDGKGKGDDEDGKAKEPPKPVAIDLDGFEARAIELPIPRGLFGDLSVSEDGKLVFTRRPRPGSEEKGSIEIFDAEAKKKEERVKTVVSGIDFFRISADGKKLLVAKDKTLALVEPKPDQKLDATVPTDGMAATVDPRAEWRQMFDEAWRLERDFFYDPGMHGVDWKKVREQYGAMLADCASRDDLGYVIREMIAELNVGHAYYFDEGPEGAPKVTVGMPGADFELADGAYRIARIYRGAPWDADARGPLGEPGIDVREGDFLLEVNGAPVDPSKAPWAAFQGLADQTVTLTVSKLPRRDATAREVVVRLAASESPLRFRAWVEANRRHVEEKSGGRIAYVYVPNTGVDGQNELFRQFYGQVEREALIVDERWNGGGQIPTRFIELLDRPLANLWARRDGSDWPWPPDALFGPKAMLINGLAGSGGDYFPYWFKKRGLGKLIGTRTWGGLVGISGNPDLIDGAVVTVPTFAFYEPDGTWGVEGHGVDPDIEVIDDPGKMAGGRDIQLDAAIEHLLGELERAPFRKPARPAYPNRSGMGLPPEDH